MTVGKSSATPRSPIAHRSISTLLHEPGSPVCVYCLSVRGSEPSSYLVCLEKHFRLAVIALLSLLDETELAPWPLPISFALSYRLKLKSGTEKPDLLTIKAPDGKRHYAGYSNCKTIREPALTDLLQLLLSSTATYSTSSYVIMPYICKNGTCVTSSMDTHGNPVIVCVLTFYCQSTSVAPV